MNRKTINIILMLPACVAAVFVPLTILSAELLGSAMSGWYKGVDREPDFYYVMVSSSFFAAFFVAIAVGVAKSKRWALVVNYITLVLIDLGFALHNYHRISSYRETLDLTSLSDFGDSNGFYLMMLLLNVSFVLFLAYLTGESWKAERGDKLDS